MKFMASLIPSLAVLLPFAQELSLAQGVVVDREAVGPGEIRRIPLDPKSHTSPASVDLSLSPCVVVARRGGHVDFFRLNDGDPPRRLSVSRSDPVFPAAVTSVSGTDGTGRWMFTDSEGGVITFSEHEVDAYRTDRFPLLQAATEECWESLGSEGIPQSSEEFLALQPLRVNSCSFSDSGNLLCLSYGDGTIDVRDARSGQRKFTLDGFVEVRHLDVPTLLQEFGAENVDRTDRAGWPWWLRYIEPEGEFEGVRVVHSRAASRSPYRHIVGLAENANTIILDEQHRIFAVDLETGEVVWEQPWLYAFLEAETNQLLGCAIDSITVFEADAVSGEIKWESEFSTPAGYRRHGVRFSISEDRTRVAALISQYLVVVYDRNSGEVIWNSKDALPRNPDATRRIVDVALSPDGRSIVVIDLGSAIYECRIESNE